MTSTCRLGLVLSTYFHSQNPTGAMKTQAAKSSLLYCQCLTVVELKLTVVELPLPILLIAFCSVERISEDYETLPFLATAQWHNQTMKYGRDTEGNLTKQTITIHVFFFANSVSI